MDMPRVRSLPRFAHGESSLAGEREDFSVHQSCLFIHLVSKRASRRRVLYHQPRYRSIYNFLVT